MHKLTKAAVSNANVNISGKHSNGKSRPKVCNKGKAAAEE
jgi:hypothetical protein